MAASVRKEKGTGADDRRPVPMQTIPKGRRQLRPVGYFDSPVIYGVRVETSNPYHLLYTETILNCNALDANKIAVFSAKVNCISCKNWPELKKGFWQICTNSLFWKIIRKALRRNRFRFLNFFIRTRSPCRPSVRSAPGTRPARPSPGACRRRPETFFRSRPRRRPASRPPARQDP